MSNGLLVVDFKKSTLQGISMHRTNAGANPPNLRASKKQCREICSGEGSLKQRQGSQWLVGNIHKSVALWLAI